MQTIESAFLAHLDQIRKVYGGKIGKLTPKGEHVYKNTWLCASRYFWREFQLVLMIDSDEAREARLKEIRREIESSSPSEMLIRFHKTCFPNLPIQMLDATWKCCGNDMTEIAVSLLALPPGKDRESEWAKLDHEMLQLKTLWMIPPTDFSAN